MLWADGKLLSEICYTLARITSEFVCHCRHPPRPSLLLDRDSSVQSRNYFRYARVLRKKSVGVPRSYNSVFGNSVFDGVAVSDVEVEYRGLAVKGIGMEVKRRMNYEITGLALP